MKKSFFITGTDTGVGKTCATVALMHYFKQQGQTVLGMKPVAAGCEWMDGQFKNEDALLLQEHASDQLQYTDINPYAFELPVSPHLAAKDNPVKIEKIVESFIAISNKAEVVLVEGAGGWFAPLNKEQDIADLAQALNIPVILVVGIKLGCINHAKLTFQAINATDIQCHGWLAVCNDADMQCLGKNIETIKEMASAPLLGVLPYMKKIDYQKLASEIVEEI
jgi:dethiobiotin synthetase